MGAKLKGGGGGGGGGGFWGWKLNSRLGAIKGGQLFKVGCLVKLIL